MRRGLLVAVWTPVAAAVALILTLHAVWASGTGGTISLGAVGGSGSSRTIEIMTGTAADPWSGYNIHVAATLGGALTLDSITAVNGSLLTGGQTCFESTSAAGQHVLGCSTLGAGRPAITAAGELAVFTFNTTGNGCLQVNLVTVPGSNTKDTYTLDWASSQAQTNAVDEAPIKIIVGSGTNQDCDTDNDGCSNANELLLEPPADPADPWDFYSVPVPPLFLSPSPLTDVRDRLVAASDAQAVFAYFKVAAKAGSAEYDQDLDLNGVADGLQYDRTVVGAGQSGPPDGIIAASDAQLAFAQFKLAYRC